MVSDVESCFKAKMVPILDLSHRLPTNAPRFVNVSQSGERGVGLSKAIGEEKGKVWEGLFLLNYQLRYQLNQL